MSAEVLAVRDYTARFFRVGAEEISVVKLTGDASTRVYFRVHLPEGRTYVIARYGEPFDPVAHPYCDVTELFACAGLPVPELIDVNGKEGMMLQQDLGDVRLQDWQPTAGAAECRSAYREAVDLILRIQDATQLAYDRGSIASRLAFDVEKLEWELRFFYTNFFEKYLGRSLRPDLKERVFRDFVAIAQYLAAIPRVLTHRDFHSRNLMLHDGRQYIIDHQDARMGPPSYDLASLLGDPYVRLDVQLVEEIYEYFIESKVRREGDYYGAEWVSGFREEFQVMTVQRLLKATGTYAYQTAVVGNPVYLPYIPRALAGAMNMMKALGRYDALREALETVAERIEGMGGENVTHKT